MNLYIKNIFLIILLAFNISCYSYNTDFNELEKITVSSLSEIKKGESCSRNLFGGFTIPYIGETAIKLSGDQSVISAIKNANIQSIYAVDKYSKNYFLFSKRCTVVFGR